MGDIIREIDHPVRELRGVRLFVRQNIWDDGVSGYTVLREGDEDPLRDEDWDDPPTDADIMAEPGFTFWRLTAGHAYHVMPVIGCSSCEAISPGEWRDRYADYLDATE